MRSSLPSSLCACLCILLGACELPPDTPIYASGVAEDAKGNPLALATLRISRGSELYADGGAITASFLFDWRETGTLQTQLDGRFAYAMTSQNTYGYTSLNRLQVPDVGSAAGPAYWVIPLDMDLPVARAWELAPLYSHADHVTTLSLDAVPDYHGNAESAGVFGEPNWVDDYRFEVFLGEALVWVSWETQPTVSLSDALFESAAQVRVHVTHYQETSQFAHTLSDVEQTNATIGVEYEHDLLLDVDAGAPPVSRGASCSGADVPADPCPFTDGRFQPLTVRVPDSGILSFDLARPAQLRELVMRHALQSAEFHVDVSGDDGGTWTGVYSTAAYLPGTPDRVYQSSFGAQELEQTFTSYGFVDATFPVTTPVTKFRVVFDSTYGDFAFSQVSVFE